MRIEAVTMTNNEASQAILKKLGFEFDALMRNYRYYEGNFHDVNMYSITPKLWLETEFAGKKAEPSLDEEKLIEEMFA